MKRVLFILYICCCSLSISAADVNIVLRVELKDGTNNDYLLEDRPQINFESNKVVFLCKNISTSYNRENVRNFVFLNVNETGIQKLMEGDTRFSYSIGARQVTIEGDLGSAEIKVYSISGQQFNPEISRSSNQVMIYLASLPDGYYIINIGNKQSIKIIKK